MKIWKLKFDVNKYNLWSVTDRVNLVKRRETFNGRKRIDTWKPIKIGRIDSGGASGANAMKTDFGVAIIDKKVVKCVSDLIENSVEFLPVFIEDEVYNIDDFYILNIITQLNCIDFDASEGEGLLGFDKIVFTESIVKGQHIFKAENDLFPTIYISDELKQMLDENDLKGFLYELAWDSEEERAVEDFRESENLKKEEQIQAYKLMKKGTIENLAENEWITAIMAWIWGKSENSSEDIVTILTKLPLQCQYIFSMFTLKWEIENGGYTQLFYNFGIEMARIAKKGFAELEFNDLSLITTDAIEAYEETSIKSASSESDNIEDFMNIYNTNPLTVFTGYFMSSFSLDKIEEKSIEYIRINKEYFGD